MEESPVLEEQLAELDRHVKMRLNELMNNSPTKIPDDPGSSIGPVLELTPEVEKGLKDAGWVPGPWQIPEMEQTYSVFRKSYTDSKEWPVMLDKPRPEALESFFAELQKAEDLGYNVIFCGYDDLTGLPSAFIRNRRTLADESLYWISDIPSSTILDRAHQNELWLKENNITPPSESQPTA